MRLMKKLIAFLMAVISTPALANTLMGTAQNQMGVNLSQSVGPGGFWHLIPGNDWQTEAFQYAAFQYSQPTEVFRLPARLNLHIGYLVGWGDMSHDYSDPFAGMSWDVAIASAGNFYAGTGLGPYIKLDYDGRQDSLLMFGTKIFVGYAVSNEWRAELNVQHMDSAGLTPIDGGYNFVGLSILKSF